MPQFLVESSHTPEECLHALDEVLKNGKDRLDTYEWGCMAGNHTGWAIVDAPNETEARKNYVPSFLQTKARVTPVSKFTPEQINSLHQKKSTTH